MEPRRPPDSRVIPAVLVVVVAIGAGVVFGRGVAPTPAAPMPPSPTTVAETARISVHVSGWVNRPGVVEAGAGAHVADVIAAAGGLRPGASVESVNLAAQVADGQQVVVPGPSSGGDHPEAVADDGIVRLNAATAPELERLPGVGPVLAQRIVDHRDANGPFQVVEDLLEVSGIGEAKLATLRDDVVVP